jgi:hypothetical protein
MPPASAQCRPSGARMWPIGKVHHHRCNSDLDFPASPGILAGSEWLHSLRRSSWNQLSTRFCLALQLHCTTETANRVNTLPTSTYHCSRDHVADRPDSSIMMCIAPGYNGLHQSSAKDNQVNALRILCGHDTVLWVIFLLSQGTPFRLRNAKASSMSLLSSSASDGTVRNVKTP